jgi:very-short-patch-repair endonuclease
MREGRKTRLARQLRSRMTDAERELWHHLRNRSFMRHKFRRQHPIGPYVVDFVCLRSRLVVELDGGQHACSANDAIRADFLERHGYRILRFWNNDVFEQQEAVLAVIFEALQSCARSSIPLLRAGEG